jgi:hypothetical protein
VKNARFLAKNRAKIIRNLQKSGLLISCLNKRSTILVNNNARGLGLKSHREGSRVAFLLVFS